ncbi:alpha/beta hydrolase [Bosea sp. (in: a-proteobacteria)]|uniref:alpha/beta hydrolase n=1 Tax=Bosea sp. (in: a-proteobacteria) TaxID=1871050 RepID=UPI0026058B46|nr:alpha/beta hydrolase [Bosea sp. (in: a-proteobacteria)]MCO5093382.1 alpha/beta hydrolase [Bosea sp. (in: a-proteobacteria)]
MSAFVHPQMAPILAAFAAAPGVDFKTLPIAEARSTADAGSIAWNEGAPDIPAREITVRLDGASLRGRLYHPKPGTALPLVVYVHGGGWTFGSVDTHDGTMRTLVAASGCAIFGFDYRLAPEYPYPIPLEDTLGAIAFALSGELGSDVDERRWALAGDSAGATLALAAMIQRRDAGLALPAAAALFYGCYAPDFESGSHARFGEGYLLTTANMRWYWRNYLGAAFDAPPALGAPLHADLAGLPPLYLAAGGLDPLADDTRRLADRIAAADVAFRHDHVPGVVHGCLRMSRKLAPAQAMIDAAAAYITERL